MPFTKIWLKPIFLQIKWRSCDLFKKHIQYKDSLMGDQVTQQVTSMGLKYESDIKLVEEKVFAKNNN
ncbi:MAG: hypothetical protein IPG08_00135 [Sphingobacteriaceae bacterium]|nr:hypothetical protein [Sphingobacteriaceae bacterium]